MNTQYLYVHACPDSTYEDIQDLQANEQEITLATFRKNIGAEQWAWLQGNLGYDRSFPISNDWHVRYYKSFYRGVPAYFLRHSRIEYIFTLNGELGPSLAES